jgi:sugar transferase (PEP-CTERM/EpsH1 system associated)
VATDARPLVLHVIHHLVVGGMENNLINLINRMPESRFRHAIACVEDFAESRRRLVRADVEVVALHRSQIGVHKLRRELFRLCRRLGPTIVHSRNRSGLDALLPARLGGVRYCVHGEHGWDMDDLHGEKWKSIWLRRIHSPLIDRYIAVSKDLERYLTHRVGIAARRVRQIYNGVDTERFAPSADKPASLLPPNLAGRDLFVIGTVGRIQAVKDQATLLRAFAELMRFSPGGSRRLRLAVVGDGPLLGQLRELAQSLGIAELTWFPGVVGNIPDVLRLLDVFVLPSLSEGISNTILEAMASRLPVLATARGGNVELIEDGVSGRLFEPGDVTSLARMLGEYLASPAVYRAHAEVARRQAVERFSLSAMVANYEAVYESAARR